MERRDLILDFLQPKHEKEIFSLGGRDHNGPELSKSSSMRVGVQPHGP